MNTIKYKGYTGTVEYSEEDNCLFGKVLGIPKSSLSYEGESVNDLINDFRNAIDDYLAECDARGIEPTKPFSGSLNVRIPIEMHERIAIASRAEGVSINAIIKRALEREFKGTKLAY